jgi:hypothetical protein
VANCTIHDISAQEDVLIELRKMKHQLCLVVGIIRPSGELVALRADSVYEGSEWLDLLMEASQLSISKISSMTTTRTTTTHKQSSFITPASREMHMHIDQTHDDDNKEAATTTKTLRPPQERQRRRQSHDRKDSMASEFQRARAPALLIGYSIDEHDLDHRKDVGSLLRWIMEDSRNQLILLLLGLLVWFVSAHNV